MSENKTQPTEDSIEGYIQAIENTLRRHDAQQMLGIMQAVTHDEPVLWGASIVGFGKYHYKYESGREGDTVAVGFAARKAALVIYGLFHYAENNENIALAKQLGSHTHGKGCVYIKSLDAINLDILQQMIANAYSARNN